MSDMMQITQEQLMTAFETKKGARIVTIVSKTDAGLRKTGNPLGPVFKISRVNGVVNFNYTNAVNAQRAREGNEEEFVAKPRKWGSRMAGMPFIEHVKDGATKYYLEMKIEKSLGHAFFDALGNPLADDVVAPFLPKKGPSKTQETEKEINVKDYALDNIWQITFGGGTYTVVK